jgi:competence protein CoiA
MRFAVVEGKRREAQPGCSAECPACGQAMIARCGEHKVWHWAHRGARICDHWWESETEWHRGWKNHFPKDWQETSCRSDDGEKHFADVRTESGLVLEFQHSFLRRDERESREIFYQNMVWVVDGRRRARDRARFFASLGSATLVKLKPLTFSFPSNEGALLRDWAASRVPVFFDFGDLSEPSDPLGFDKPILWRFNPRSPNGRAYLSPVLKTLFLHAHLTGQPLKGLAYSTANERARPRRAPRFFIQRAHQPRWTMGFQQYMARKQKARTRARF